MLEFAMPWLFYLLPLPLLAYYGLPRLKNPQSRIQVPRLQPFQLGQQAIQTTGLSLIKLVLLSIAWVSLLTAAAQPRWLADAVNLPISGRDLMLALDLSGSMKERDFIFQRQRIDRLTASKIVVADFIEKRQGDRLGLIVFGEQAYLQTPLTFDTKTVASLVEETFIGLAGEKATAIGDAIGIAIKRLTESQQSDERTLILVTDGANNAGAITPNKAAELAANSQLKIYTIGIGADEQIIETWFGKQRHNPSKDLDEKTLKMIANTTGGRYFRARNTEELQKIYSLIDQLEPIEKEQAIFKPTKSLFYWPLLIMLLSLSSIACLQIWQQGLILPSRSTMRPGND